MKFQGDILNFGDFIQVFVFTTKHHLNALVVEKVTFLRRQVPLVFTAVTSKNDVILCKLDVNVKNRTADGGSVDFFKLQ